MTLVVLLGTLLVLAAFGTPLAFAILGSCFATLALFRTGLPLELVAQQFVKGIDNLPLTAIALFLLAGELMNSGGVTGRIVQFASALVGHIRGGLGHVSVVASMIISGISGSAVADGAAVGAVMVPAMRRGGFPPAFAAAVCETAAVMGPIIPPSIPMVVYGILVEVSVGRLFVAGIVPGLLIGVLLMVVLYIVARRRDFPRGQWQGFGHVGRSFVAAFAALLTPLIVIGGILAGAFTATEAGVVAVVYCVVIGILVHRELTLGHLATALVNSANGTAMVMVIVGASQLMGWIVADLRINQAAGDLIFSMTQDPVVFLTIVNVFFLIVGLFMDPLAALIVLVPILLPTATSMHIDPVHFGLVVVLNLMIGLCTPPVGYLIYMLAGIAKEPPSRVIKESLPFLAALLVALAAVTYIPALSLSLGRVVYGS
jgi:tripartite ATP-independent transporter DctM subunit